MLSAIKEIFKSETVSPAVEVIETKAVEPVKIPYFKTRRWEKFSYQNRLHGYIHSIKHIRQKLVCMQQKEISADIPTLQQLNLHLSFSARHTLLAYMFLKGRPYKTVEIKCDPNNKPQARSIYEIIKELCGWTKIKTEEIEAWLGIE